MRREPIPTAPEPEADSSTDTDTLAWIGRLDASLRGLPSVALLSQAFDEIDYGLLIVRPDGLLVQANQTGRRHCTQPQGALQLRDGLLHARLPQDEAELLRALAQAAHQGLRRLLGLGGTEQPETVAVVPLPGQDAALVVFGRRQVCELLSIEHFARLHGLTHAESMVLAALCDGEDPAGIARRFGVALSTVRTQISSIRQKTRSSSLRALVRQVALLPPIVSVLSHTRTH
ncbi:DNA-binding NarL/FixJ family response regulator [Sphaerotilus sulfidivorans]|jgi:DNA-binding NarL/FixJ family response regulator|uniref:DNA-binding NarL/FixJ family response regulator n=1 Tax=Sphaerotilus sulfidivorans TaxID=639200 RepID=A0A5C1Q5H5_9BURK|nr:LuxR C-terminal-related transcriptional regulator [Sphaerotilus sulfidivorans]MBP8175095.1 helix-turn-helix transcriptional regulator [Sphaerotilus sp.]NZD45563.1 helix-turn-helix transcriptional regulator [Sphaerotilus sulfidivorans]QEN02056.1 helix-turn-helix transcriptional regulator [Sphaerotilus sulfidivorans]